MSFIRRQVGLRSDAASAGGSLHAKVAELRSYFENELRKYQKPRKSIKASYTADAGSAYVTAFNISGRGRLTHFRIMITSTNASPIFRIVIDGEEVIKGQGKSGVASKYQYPTSGFLWTNDEATRIVDDTVSGMINMIPGLSFKSSLLIQTKGSTASGMIVVNIIYEIE